MRQGKIGIQYKNIVLHGILSIMMVFGIVFGCNLHVQADVVGEYMVVTGGKSGTDYSYQNNVLTILTDTPMTIRAKEDYDNNLGWGAGFDSTYYGDDRIVIAKDVNANLTIQDLTIQKGIDEDGEYVTYSTNGGPAIQIEDDSNGDVTIVLKGYNELSGYNGAAIQKNGTGGSLTIKGTGELSADSYSDKVTNGCAAIGSSAGCKTGNIVIESGTIWANSYIGGAGIGGGYEGELDGLTINGGTIISNGWRGGAGIGGGYKRSGKNITINGGTITAKANLYEDKNKRSTQGEGAGIGGGGAAASLTSSGTGDGVNITINGGTVTASCGTQADNYGGGAGIGGGFRSAGVNIQIHGGTVNATGGNFAAGIGGGGAGYRMETTTSENARPLTNSSNSITITGGTITAQGTETGAGIGGGYGRSADVTISGGRIVKASCVTKSSSYIGGAGIGGGGYYDNNATDSIKRYGAASGVSIDSIVTITSGTIDSAIGGSGAAGIGEIYGRKGTVYVSGGSMQATKGAAYQSSSGEDVGSGAGAAACTIVKSNTDNTVVTKQEFGGFKANQEANFKVTDADGTSYSYGTMNVYADASGKLYLYLPEGSKVQEVSGNTWEGSFAVAPRLKGMIYTEASIKNIALYQSGKLVYGAAKQTDGTFLFAKQDYEKGTYNLYIDGENSGKTVIIGSVADGEEIAIPYYTVSNTELSHASITYDSQTIRENGACTFHVTPAEGYRVSSVLCQMNGTTNVLQQESDGSYKVSNIQGDVTITPIIVVDQIEVDLSNVTWDYKGPYYYDNKTTYKVELASVPEGVDVTYSGNSAKEVGEYTAKATIKAKDGYVITKEAVISDLKWSVDYYPTDGLTILYNGDKNKKNTYEKAPVVVNVDGYQVCTSPTGSFGISYEFQATDTKTLYFKNKSTGYITAGVKVSVQIDVADTIPPEVQIEIDGRTYNKVQNTVTFKRYKILSTTAQLSATDNSSKSVKVEYAISENILTSASKIEAAKLTWTEGTSCTIATDKNQVVYVRATDKAGNVAYASTKGIYADTKAPVITNPSIALTNEAATDSVDIHFTVDEACTYYYAVLPATSNLSKEDIVSQGISNTVSQGRTVAATVSGLSAATTYRLYVYANDGVTTLLDVAAGNESEIAKSDSVTTAKDTLVVDTMDRPVLSGIYGTKVADMTITGGTVKCGLKTVAGTWTITDKNASDVPGVGSTNQYTLTFTPQETALYNAITYEVVPKVTAKQLTKDMLTVEAGSVYTGSAITPEVTVQDGSAALVKGADYTVSYENNVNAGNVAKVTITGKKNYKGSVTGTFSIAKATLTSIDKPVYVNVTVGSHTVVSNLEELLPAMSAEDRAGITYSEAVQSGNVVDGTPTIQGAEITIGLNTNAAAGSEQKITITMSSNNYEDMTAQLIIKVTAKTVVTLSDDVKAVDSEYDGSAKTGYEGSVFWNGSNGKVNIAEADTTILYSGTTAAGEEYGPSKEKPTQAGNYKISFSVDNAQYNGNKVISFAIAKKVIDVSKVSLQQKYYVYTGQKITAILQESSVPREVTYTVTGDQATNAGSYQMVVTYQVKDSNYEQPEAATFNWMITKAAYDISAITWNYTEAYTYDGNRKTVQLKNLPDVLEAVYTGNSEIEPGKYTATAQLQFKDTAMSNNYTLGDVAELDWEIQKAQEETKVVTLYGVKAIDSVYEKNMHPQGYTGTPVWKNGEDVIDVVTKILYTGREKDGTAYETSTIAPTNAGEYAVTFLVEDDSYQGAETFDYTIEKASYDMSHVAWNYSGTAFYEDGTVHSVEVFNLPTGVTAQYTDNTSTTAGEYEAGVTFTVKDSNNYNIPDPIENCKWKIEALSESEKTKKVVTLSGVKGQDSTYADASNKGYSGNVIWKTADGETVSVKATTVSYYGKAADGAVYAASNQAPVNAGSYIVSFTVVDDAYIGTGSVTYNIQKASYSLDNVHWNYSGTAFEYDGTEHRVELTGLPKGIHVSYTNNAAKEVGTYIAEAECVVKDSANYKISGTIEPLSYEIVKGIIKVDQVTWNYTDEPFEYDGNEHSVLLQNVPDNVLVTYTGNTATAKGSYTAKATLSAKDSIHYEVSDTNKICEWSITDKDDVKVTLSDAVTAEENLVYDGKAHAGYTGDAVWYEQGTTTKVDGITTKIQYNGVNGTQYTSANAPTKAGDYTVTFTATAQDGISVIPKTLSFKIQKAKYAMDNVKWNYSGTAFEYDGDQHWVEVEGLPEGVQARYTNNAKTSVGVYTATVQFVVTDSDNYEIPAALAACRWEIKAKKEADPTKKDYDMSNVKWDYSGTAFGYDGTEKVVQLTGLPDGVTVFYTNNRKTEAGDYTAIAQFTVNDPNTYNVPESMRCNWSIKQTTEPDNPDQPGTDDPDKPAPDNPGTDQKKDDKQNTSAKDTATKNIGTQVEQAAVGDVVTVGNNIYKVEDVAADNKSVSFTGLADKNVTSVDVPNTIQINGENYAVVSVENNAFKDCKKLKKVKLGANLTKIGDKVFYKCTSLTSVVIPAKVTSIGKEAFFGAKKLKKITIKSKVLKKVGNKAIKGIHKKAVIKCPNKKLATQYKKKLFKAKTGYIKSMKIK